MASCMFPAAITAGFAAAKLLGISLGDLSFFPEITP